MNEIEEFEVNDTTRAIRAVGEMLRDSQADMNPRIKAMIITQLEIAELLSFRLIHTPKP